MENNEEKEYLEEDTMEYSKEEIEETEEIEEVEEDEVEEKETNELIEQVSEFAPTPDNNDGNKKKIIIIVVCALALLVIIALIIFIMSLTNDKKKSNNTTTNTEQKDKNDKEENNNKDDNEEKTELVELPKLKNENKKYAQDKLEELGLEVEIQYESSEEISKDFVIDYKDNEVGDKLEVGESVILIVSSGTKYITLANYVGKDATATKTDLEGLGIKVSLVKKNVTKDDNKADGTILEQDKQAGEKLEAGDTITLTYAYLVPVYPDFTDGTYTKDSITKFCSDHKLVCTFTEKQSEEESGTILGQNFEPGKEVIEGATLRIDIAQ